MNEHMEIERRFIVDGREEKPWRQNSDVHRIEQHYTVGDWLNLDGNKLVFEGEVVTQITPVERNYLASTDAWTTRLRQRDDDYILTYKAKVSGDTSLELEWNVEGGVARRLLAKGPFPAVEKTRYVLTGADGLTWEVDEFEGLLGGLVIAEVELTREDEAVKLPDWLGLEITHLGNWSNADLARSIKSATDKIPGQ